MTLDDIYTYCIRLAGRVDQEELNAMTPVQVTVGGVEQVERAVTLFTVRTDQSGLIGLMRHLHGLGFVLLSVNRER